MTDRIEKVIVLKERYLIITEGDMAKAEFLSWLVANPGWVPMSRDQQIAMLTIPVALDTMSRKIHQLEKKELVVVDRTTRPHRYQLNADKWDEVVQDLDMILVEGFVTDYSTLVNFDTKKVYINPKQADKKSAQVETSRQVVGLRPNNGKQADKKSAQSEDRPTNSRLKSELDRQIVGLEKDSYNRVLYTTGVTSEESNAGVTTVAPDTDTTPVAPEVSTLTVEPDSFARTGNKFYTWEHYAQFTKEDWTLAKTELKWPKKESAATMLIGAYLIGMHRVRKMNPGLVPGDFGKYRRVAKVMHEFFTEQAQDETKGFCDALDWIKEFINFPPSSFEGKTAWAIDLCFTRSKYRQKGMKTSQGKSRNNTGIVVMTDEQRDQEMKTSTRIIGRIPQTINDDEE